MSKDWELVHLHRGLVLSIDTLMSNQSCCSDHVCRHSIPNEQNNVLGPLLLLERTNNPIGYRLCAIVVVECSNIITGFVQCYPSVCLGGHTNNGWSMGILCKQVLVPSEVPALESRLGDFEEGCSRLSSSSNLLDREGKVGVWDTAIGLRTIDGSMNLFFLVPQSQLKSQFQLRRTSNRISKYCPARKSV